MEKKRRWSRVRSRRGEGGVQERHTEGSVGSTRVRFEQRLKETRDGAMWTAAERVGQAERTASARARRQSQPSSFREQPGDLCAWSRIRKGRVGAAEHLYSLLNIKRCYLSPDVQLLSWKIRSSGHTKHIFSCNVGQGRAQPAHLRWASTVQ